MAGISLPGVSDKYKTNDLIEALMNQERLPLEREKKTLDGYKVQQDAWRSVNKNMSTLRETVKSLYSLKILLTIKPLLLQMKMQFLPLQVEMQILNHSKLM